MDKSRVVTNLSITDDKLEYLYDKGIFILPGGVDENAFLNMLLNMLYRDFRSSTNPTSQIWLLIDSPGGIITQGLAIYDIVTALVKSGRIVNTVGIGEVASMAVCILQAGSRRYSLPNTQYTVHQASMGSPETIEEVNKISENVKELHRLNDVVLKILSARSGMDLAKLKKLSKKTDVSFDAIQAKKFGPYGLVDEIVETLPFLSPL